MTINLISMALFIISFFVGWQSFAGELPAKGDGCPRLVFSTGQEGLDWEMINKLTNTGTLKLVPSTSRLSHSVHDSIRYYLVSTSYCHQKTPTGCNTNPTSDKELIKGRKTLFDDFLNVSDLNPARSKLKQEAPALGGRAIYDGRIQSSLYPDERLCFYHYTPSG